MFIGATVHRVTTVQQNLLDANTAPGMSASREYGPLDPTGPAIAGIALSNAPADMKTRLSITRAFLLTFLTLFLLSFGIVGYVWISGEYASFRAEAASLKAAFFQDRKSLIVSEVEKVVDYIHYRKNRTEKRLKEIIRRRTDEAHAVATSIYRQYRDDHTGTEIREMIRNALRPIRYRHGKGYFFALNFSGEIQLHADRPHLEGSNLLHILDTRGQPVNKHFIEIARTKGEGFYRYTWTKPGESGRDYPKISFVKHFKPYDWIIGTGAYLDDVERDIKEEVLDRIAEIRFEGDNYIFAGEWNGMSLTEPSKGKDMWEVTDVNGVKIVQALVAKARSGGGFVRYVLPRFSNRRSAPKISYVKAIPDWQWYVGAGVYVDEVEAIIGDKRAILHRTVERHILKIALILLGLTGAMCGAAALIHRRLDNSFRSFMVFFRNAAQRKEVIDPDRLSFSEFIAMGRSANEMIDARNRAEADLKWSEEKYRQLFRHASDAVLVLDETTHAIVDANRAALALFGYTEGEIAALSWEDLSEADRLPTIPSPDQRPLDPSSSRFQFLRKNGGLFAGEVSTGRFEADGRAHRILTVRDTSERDRLENQLRQAQKMEAIGAVAGGIAHDFNNILGVIMGNAQLMEMEADDLPRAHSIRKRLSTMLDAAERARELVRQILTFSRSVEQDKQPTLLSPIVKEALKFIRSSIPSTIGIEQRSISDRITVLADPTQMYQVILNLCTNAAQAMGEAGGKLTVSIDIHESEAPTAKGALDLTPGPYVRLSVADTGPGMDVETRQRIFEPYFTTKSADEGTGLGLAVVHGIVSSHGGAIHVYSEPGTGSVFNVYLPLAATATDTVADRGLPDMPRGGERILLVDDEEMLVEWGREALERLGYRVTALSDSRAALALFVSRPRDFDLVITDVTMPGMTGDALAREAKAVRPDIPVILCTGFTGRFTPESVREMGLGELIYKPLNIRSLAETIRAALEEPAQQACSTTKTGKDDPL